MPTRPSKPSHNIPRYTPPSEAFRWKNENPEVIDPRWIMKAAGGVLAFAVLCAYLFICFVFSRTQWQYVLHPSRTVSATPGIAFTEVHFGVDASGQPQLDGWWIPSEAPSDPTVLLLHSGDGSMSDALPSAIELHEARLNVLLFDYRGFGRSAGNHPTEALMQADAESAFNYLTTTRGVPSQSVLIYGAGVGASLAVNLCAQHSNVAALILGNPDGDLKQRMRHDEHVHLLPVSLLFNQDFPLADLLSKLPTPKLLISTTNGLTPPSFKQAADPKMTVELKSRDDSAALHEALRRFLDSYIPRAAATLNTN